MCRFLKIKSRIYVKKASVIRGAELRFYHDIMKRFDMQNIGELIFVQLDLGRRRGTECPKGNISAMEYFAAKLGSVLEF